MPNPPLPRPRLRWHAACLGLLVAIVSVSAARATTGASSAPAYRSLADPNRPLATAVVDPENLGGPEAETAYTNLRRTGARFVRMFVNWAQVAPDSAKKPAGFDARDPGDRAYQWATLDGQVTKAVAEGFAPIVYVQTAPRWAQRCTAKSTACRPSPSELAQFMTAAARRYSGSFSHLPRVRYWQIWNEPNMDAYLVPQYANGRPASPDWYRSMVNAAAGAIHSVRKDNVVVAGGLSPFGPWPGRRDKVAPLTFMRQLLCLSSGRNPKPVCRKRVRFDVWAHHPYTSGGPAHHAYSPDDVSAPDLWKMRVLLDAAARAGTLESRSPVAFWVTEFAWDTSPPGPEGRARGAARAMGRRGPLPHVGSGRQPRHLVHAARPAVYLVDAFSGGPLLPRRGRRRIRQAEDGAYGLPFPVRRLPTAGEEIGHVLGAVSGGTLGRDRRAEATGARGARWRPCVRTGTGSSKVDTRALRQPGSCAHGWRMARTPRFPSHSSFRLTDPFAPGVPASPASR